MNNTVKGLGEAIRSIRKHRRLSAFELSVMADVHDTTIIRIENGRINSPDQLARIAVALKTPVADLYSLAGYTPASELPSLTPYMRIRYDLPPAAIKSIEAYAAAVAREYGIDLNGPAPGQDEQD